MRLERVDMYNDSQNNFSQPAPIISVYQGFIIMMVMIFFGVALSFGVGLMVDQMHDSFTDAGLYDVVYPEWDMAASTSNTMLNILYAIMYGIPILGIAIFLMSIIKNQKYENE